MKEKKEKLAKMTGQTSKEKLGSRKPRETQGFTSATHKKYANKVVFSNEVIDFKNENEGEFLTTYKIGDPLWLRVYMDNSLMNYMLEASGSKDKTMDDLHSYSTFMLTFYLNGEKIHTYTDGNARFEEKEKDNWTTFKGSFSSKEEEVFYFAEHAFKEFLIEAESKLTKGSHTFKMEIQPYYEERGFGDEKDAIKFFIDKKFTGELKLIVDGSIVDKSETKICLSKPKIRDEAAEKEFLKAFKAANPEVETFGKVIIIQDKWTVTKNEYTSIPEKKSIHAEIPMRKDGKCSTVECIFIQDFNGVGYEKMYVRYAHGGQEFIPCACLKE